MTSRGGGGNAIGWLLAIIGIGVAVYGIYAYSSQLETLISDLTTSAKKSLTAASDATSKAVSTALGTVTADTQTITATTNDYVLQTQNAVQVALPNGYTATAVDAGPDTATDYFPSGNTVDFSTLMGLDASDVYNAVVQDTTGSSQGSNVAAYWNTDSNLATQAKIDAGLAPDQQGHWLNPADPGTWFTTEQVFS